MKNTIKSHKHFDFTDSKAVTMDAFLMKFRPHMFESGQYGLTASKRTFKHAVDRNRAKRLLRTWIRIAELPKDFDILFIAKAKILETTLKDGVAQMRKALKKVT